MKIRKPRDFELTLARQAHRAGMGQADYLRIRTDALKRSAESQGWRQSELAMALGHIQGLAGKVWKTQ